MCMAFSMCCNACCLAVLLSKDITILLKLGVTFAVCLFVTFSPSYNFNIDAPNGSFATGKITGSTLLTT
jgi:hypothetical protein